MSLQALREAPPAQVLPGSKTWAGDGAAVRSLCRPLGPRCGLLQIRTAAEYTRVARTLGLPTEPPDLDRGTLIGLVSWAGSPCTGRKPIRIESVRLVEGGGLLRADFEGGTYHPDGRAFVETAFVPGLVAVLVVDLGGNTFFP